MLLFFLQKTNIRLMVSFSKPSQIKIIKGRYSFKTGLYFNTPIIAAMAIEKLDMTEIAK